MEKEQIKQLVEEFLSEEVFLTPDLIFELENHDFEGSKKTLMKIKGVSKNPVVVNKDFFLMLKNEKSGVNFEDLERLKALSEKNDSDKYAKALESCETEKPEPKQPNISENQDSKNKLSIKFSYDEKDKNRNIQSFVTYFNEKFKAIEGLLRKRKELTNLTAIHRIQKKRDREELSLIGMITEKSYTKNGNLMLTVEDQSGEVKVLINKNKPDLFQEASDIVLDEVLGINGVNGQNIVFANNVIWPDIPYKEFKKADEEAYAIFLSDIHVGSNNYLGEEFEKFIKWLRCEVGSEKQKAIAAKIKYIFIVGDLVDGVGIYPGQEKELDIVDIYDQYIECARLLKMIPEHIKIIACPGNHDAMRLSEPQKPIYKDYAAPLWDIPNLTMVSNPSLVNIHADENFPGFDVLLYHGYSFDYFIANVESLRNNGGYDRADLVMKFLLKRRHLAPTHESTLHSPDDKDYLVIDTLPDFFATGHIHKSSVSNYRNITLICGSCWQAKTSFQEKVGHHPEPCRVPIVNLQTRKVKILRFGND